MYTYKHTYITIQQQIRFKRILLTNLNQRMETVELLKQIMKLDANYKSIGANHKSFATNFIRSSLHIIEVIGTN